MKKLIFLIALIFTFVAVNAQGYGNFTKWGTAADTLVASATKTAEFTLVSEYASKVSLCLFTDAISGTPAYTAVLYKKLTGFEYVSTGDTIRHSGGGDKTAFFTVFDLTANTYKVAITATGGAQKSRLYLNGLYRR